MSGCVEWGGAVLNGVLLIAAAAEMRDIRVISHKKRLFTLISRDG